MQGITTEKLHALLHSLDAVQRQTLDSVFEEARERPLGVLYCRILEQPEWNEQTEKQLRGRKFSNSGFYWRVRQELANGIVDHLMPADSSLPAVDGIRTAVHLDLLPVACERAVKEAEAAHERGDPAYLNLLLTTLHELQTTYHFRIDLPEYLPHWTETHVKTDLRHQLLRILDHIRLAFKERDETRIFVGKGLAARLRETDWGSCSESFELTKAWVGAHLLMNDLSSAIVMQEKIVLDMEAHPERYAVPVVCTEMTIFISFMLLTGKREKAIYYASRLSERPLGNRIEVRLQMELSISTQIIVAESLGELKLAEGAEKRLLDSTFIDANTRAGMQIRLAFLYFYYDKIEDSRKWINKLSRIPLKYCKGIKWELSLFNAILNWENGDPDLAESYLESARKRAQRKETIYQREATKAFRAIFIAKDPWKNSSQLIQKLSLILEDKREKRQAWLLDLRLYIEARSKNIPMAEIIKNANRDMVSVQIPSLLS